MFNSFPLFALELISDVLIRDLVDNRVEFLDKRRICQQTELHPLLLRLLKLTEQISPYFVFVFVNDDGHPQMIPLLPMTLDGTFVLDGSANALKYAFFKGYAQMVGARSQGALRNRKLPRHLPVMLDFRVSLVKMVVEDKLLLVRRQKSQAL